MLFGICSLSDCGSEMHHEYFTLWKVFEQISTWEIFAG